MPTVRTPSIRQLGILTPARKQSIRHGSKPQRWRGSNRFGWWRPLTNSSRRGKDGVVVGLVDAAYFPPRGAGASGPGHIKMVSPAGRQRCALAWAARSPCSGESSRSDS
eukprot:1188820-Prorocentrum_minimum.AAC.2